MYFPGTRRPVIVIGNKVDLIPSDGPAHLTNISEALTHAIDDTELGQANVVDTCLVSAVTGFGIESLVDSIHNHWGNKGYYKMFI